MLLTIEYNSFSSKESLFRIEKVDLELNYPLPRPLSLSHTPFLPHNIDASTCASEAY